MRNLLTALVLLAAGVVALGYCRDWFTVSTREDRLTDQVEVSVHIDKSKIRYDARQAKQAVRSWRQEVADLFDDRDEAALPDFNP
jgi:hypothetical protein